MELVLGEHRRSPKPICGLQSNRHPSTEEHMLRALMGKPATQQHALEPKPAPHLRSAGKPGGCQAGPIYPGPQPGTAPHEREAFHFSLLLSGPAHLPQEGDLQTAPWLTDQLWLRLFGLRLRVQVLRVTGAAQLWSEVALYSKTQRGN